MYVSFENPFVPESKKAKKSLLDKKIRTDKIWPESIKKVDELLKLGHYGDLELYQKEVDFLNDLESYTINWYKRKVGKPPDKEITKYLIQQMCLINNHSITELDLYADIPTEGRHTLMCIFDFKLPNSIVNLKKLKKIMYYSTLLNNRLRKLGKLLPNIEFHSLQVGRR